MSLPTLTVLINGADVTRFVQLVDGYTVTRGRADWQGAVTAGELSLTLNNSDGRFTPGSTAMSAAFDTLPFGLGAFGGGASSVAVDATIVLKETVNGLTYTRFTGYVKSWPVAWPATVATFSTVQITATDAQARAERRTLKSMVDEEHLALSPSAYYTLGEAEGATAAGDTSGNQVASMTVRGSSPVVTFGVTAAPGPDGTTAATFGSGQYLRGPADVPMAVSCWFKVPSAPASAQCVVQVGPWEIDVTFAGGIGITGTGISASYATPCCDGLWHHAVATWDTGTAQLWLDGVLLDTYTSVGTPTSTLASILVGATTLVAGTTARLTGSVSRVALFATGLTSSDVAAIYAAGSGAAEPSTTRLTRFANYLNLPGGFDASLTTVPPQATAGQSAMSAIQDVADAELGTVYINNFGTLTFHNRNRVAAKTAPDLTLTSEWITPDVQPVVDDQQIVNYFEATTVASGAVQVARSAASETAHGRYPNSQAYLVQTDAEALDRANWIVGNFAEPTVRYGTLTINLYKMTPAQASTVLGLLDLDCWLRVTSLASQNPGGTTADVVVEGWQETVNATTWAITCNVVAHSLYAPLWILGTSTLDTDTRLYV